MKPAFLLALLMLLQTNPGQSQITRIRPGQQATTGSQSFSVNFEKIVLSYRSNFHNIQGEAIPSENEKLAFHSTMTLPGTLHAMINRYHSKQDTSASWLAVLYTGTEYKSALKHYKSICRQINKFRVAGVGVFKGDYEDPDPNLRFAGTSYKMESDDKLYANFYAEVDMVMNADEEWEVYLSLARKKDDQDMY